MGAYDPLSYHNGSVWPHDTAICAAGAARYGRWDVVDLIVDGALAAATHFGGRPPELFAGISRDEVPMPVAYPASCSPQAWSSASVLLLVRAMLGLEPTPTGVELRRREFSVAADDDGVGIARHDVADSMSTWPTARLGRGRVSQRSAERAVDGRFTWHSSAGAALVARPCVMPAGLVPTGRRHCGTSVSSRYDATMAGWT